MAMKRMYFQLVASVMLLVVSGCTDNVELSEVDSSEIKKIVVSAEDFVDSAESRTTLYPETGDFKWAADDMIGIFPDKGFQVGFSMEAGVGSDYAEFDGGGWALKSTSTYYAYYPFEYDNRDLASIPVSFLGQKQIGTMNLDHFGKYDYMYASGTGAVDGSVSFHFKHLIGVMALHMKFPESVTLNKVEISWDDELFITEGYFNLKEEIPTIKANKESNVLTVETENIIISEEMVVDDNTDVIIYLCSAPFELAGHTLIVKAFSANKCYEYTRSWAENATSALNCGRILNFQNVDFTLDNSSDLWNGETPDEKLEAEVDGSYLIKTAQQLAQFAKMVNEGESFAGKTVKLANNIDLNGNEWIPIGYTGTYFAGTFEGNGKSISNFKITQKHHFDKNEQNNQAAFFGVIAGDAILKNFTINEAQILYPESETGDFYGAAVVGTCYGNHTFENINVTNSTIQGNNKVAGLLAHDGSSSSITITNCHVSGCTIETKNETDGGNVAGLVGVVQTNGAKIENSTVKNCTINAINSSDSGKRGNSQLVGGIIANTKKENFNITISNCTVSGNEFNETGRNTYVSPYGDGTLVGGAREGSDYYVGIVYIDGTEYPIKPVKIGDKSYASLAAAIKEIGSDPVTIKLVENVSVDESVNVVAGSNIELDLNGCDLSYVVKNTGASAIINNKGTLEIVNTGSNEAKISFVAENPDLQEIPSYATNTITNIGKLTIGENVTVTNGSNGGASYAVDVQGGEFVLDGGKLIGNRCALRVAKFNVDDVIFTMNKGTIEAQTPAWIHLPGSSSADAPKITVTIKDGTMQSTKESSENNNVMYTYSYGNSHANTSITIEGGNFLGGTVSIGSGYKGDAPTLTIDGGKFDYDVLQWLENDESKVLYKANND